MWKDIPNWEDLYEISSDGEVRNKITKKIIVGDINNGGYHRVCLYKKGHTPSKQRFFRHRLVAELYIPNEHNLPEVNHKNHMLSDNSVANLEWVTKKENELDSRMNGAKEYKPYEVTFKNEVKKIYHVTQDLADELGLTRASIRQWLHNRCKSYSKYGIKSIKYLHMEDK